MAIDRSNENLLRRLVVEEDILIIQDLDGVCIPLVKDPLTRKLSIDYIKASNNFKNEFYVLTNGEHEGRRGVNRLVEAALNSNTIAKKEGYYLPGLAAGGIEFQDKYGNITYEGVTDNELNFLLDLPILMKKLFRKKLIGIFQDLNQSKVDEIIDISVLDTRFSPTINLNSVFELVPKNIELQVKLQIMLQEVMNECIEIGCKQGLDKSFFLHIAPNLGVKNGKEILKIATSEDIGTTDIQFMLTGAIKEAGLLVLLNKYVFHKTGVYPLGKDFNARMAPNTRKSLIELIISNFKQSDMPLLVGVGDTVTSTYCNKTKCWLRGGSDRGFLTLIQELGRFYKKNNAILIVDSSGGEVHRPGLKTKNLYGVTDQYDNLRFTNLFKGGPDEYKEWFKELSLRRK